MSTHAPPYWFSCYRKNAPYLWVLCALLVNRQGGDRANLELLRAVGQS